MLTALRKRLTYANVTATLALVFAMSGGAYAAGKYLITSTKQIKPSVLAQLKGKAGAQGPTGPGGATGPAGATGSAGPAGSTGATGATGNEGPVGHEGKEGPKGKEGKEGKQGVIHPGETLPSGATETGVWVSGEPLLENRAQIAFPIPLKEPLAFSENQLGEPENQVHYINKSGKEVPTVGKEVAASDCPGTAEKPAAAPGHLCIYENQANTESETASNEQIVNPAGGATHGLGASTSGALITVAHVAWGTWAVTGK